MRCFRRPLAFVGLALAPVACAESAPQPSWPAGQFGAMPGYAAAGSPGALACPPERMVAGGGCCAPGQRAVAGGLCAAAGDCPVGSYLAGGACRAAAGGLPAIAAACGADGDGASYAAAVARMDACQKLAALGGDVAPYLDYRCAHGEGASCTLLGHAALGEMRVALDTDLVSPPCTAKATSCSAEVQRVLPFPFALAPAGAPDAKTALARFQQGCAAGHHDGCMAAADLTAGDNAFGAAQLYGETCLTGRTAACALAVFHFGPSTSIQDPVLQRDMARVLGEQCDRGAAAACNALGFMVERGLGSDLSQDRARGLYAQACRAKNAIGCANLAFAAVNDARAARSLPLDADALAVLGQSCRSDEIKESCLAEAVMLGRGLGTKRDAKQARALLKPLCDKGYADACRELR